MLALSDYSTAELLKLELIKDLKASVLNNVFIYGVEKTEVLHEICNGFFPDLSYLECDVIIKMSNRVIKCAYL